MFELISKIPEHKSAWATLWLSALAFEVTALYFQYALGLAPCVKCIYQRTAMLGILFAGLIPFELMNPLTDPSKSNQDPETDNPPDAETDDQGFSLQADWRVGEHTLTSITAYNEWEYEFTEDQDWSGFDFSSFLPFLPSDGIVGRSWIS